ncbi:TPM domain-containing protein [Paenibacillus pinistramenti]|uniref:TPM domain-containing protein n=1 Tax=Paenibacillus pinistramenti TaxID=1768003 RepID=UPI001EF02767|nr:TPM domain-containing protein [Paenibacillus pinistramenti]
MRSMKYMLNIPKMLGALAMLLLLLVPLLAPVHSEAADDSGSKNRIYDEAQLLTQEQIDQLNAVAARYSAKRETDFIVYTTDNPDHLDVVDLTENFYDDNGPGYDKSHGNAVLLTLDMRNRDVYLAGFSKGEEYLDDSRLDKIRDKITPDLSSGDYEQAFETYIKTASRYMGFRPGVNPDNLLFNGWFQIGVSAVIGVIAVGVMAYRSGGQVTVNRMTYEDAAASGVVSHEDRYLHTTTTRQKIVRSNGGGGGRPGGGGGVTGGGHSHSGSRGSF